MTSSDCLSSSNRYRPRLSNVPRLTLPIPSIHHMTDDPKRTVSPSPLSVTPTSTSPSMFFTPIGSLQHRFPHPNRFPFARPPTLPLGRRGIEFKPPEQDVLDKNFFRAFNMEQNNETSGKTSETIRTSQGRCRASERASERTKAFSHCTSLIAHHSTLMHTTRDPHNLIDMGTEPVSSELLAGSVYELFDPLKESSRPHSWPSNLNEAGVASGASTPPFVTPTQETPPALAVSTSMPLLPFPYPIRLRLKLTTFPEIKPFSQLVQRIRNENQSKQVSIAVLITALFCFTSFST